MKQLKHLAGRLRLAASLVAAVALLWGAAAVQAEGPAGQKIPLRVEDLYLADSFEGAVIAADEQHAALIRHWIDPASKRDRQSLWLVSGSAERRRPLEAGEPDARSPVFSPDGRWIALKSTRSPSGGSKPLPSVPAASDPVTDIWLISIDGGRAIPLAGPDKPYGRVFDDPNYGQLGFSADGTKLVFVADDGRSDRTAEELAAGVEIVRPDQGEGYTGYRPAQIWVAELDLPRRDQKREHAASRITRVTNDDIWYGNPQWLPNGRSIVVHANKSPNRESMRWSVNKNFDMWEIKVGDGTQRQLTHAPTPQVFARISPDGKKLVCLTSPRNGGHYDIFNLAIVTLGDNPQMRVIVDADNLKEGQWEPSLASRDHTWDDADHVVYEGLRGVKSELKRLDINTGKCQPLVSSKYPPPDTRLQRLHKLRAKWSPPGDGNRAQRLASQTGVIRWPNGEGQQIEGALTLPPPEVAQPPYKLVLVPHGGPHSRDAVPPNFTVEILAANGYAVLRPNFRGSLGYGRKFLDGARRDLGGADMRDMLSGIDFLVRKKQVDPQRLFVYGVSYGGFSTCWLVGHTNRFRAAVAENAVTEMNVMWGASDLPSWTEWELGGTPWDAPEAMRKHSPFTYAPAVRTPTLILHSRDDRRCPITMGYMFHRALRACGVETQMVVYPDEGHIIRQPRHRADQLRRILAWFAAHDRNGRNAESQPRHKP